MVVFKVQLEARVLLFNGIQILQLHQALQVKRCAVMIGSCGAGKTTCYQTLARAYNKLADEGSLPPLCVNVLNPAAYTLDEVCVQAYKHKFHHLLQLLYHFGYLAQC